MVDTSKFLNRNPVKRADDERKAVALSLAGQSQPQIARALGIAQSTVNADLKRVRKRWAAATLGDLREVKTDELLLLTHVQQEALTAWHGSKKTGQPNAKYLDAIVKASLRKARLLGLDEPTTPVSVPDPMSFDPSAMQARLAKYEAVFGIRVTMVGHDDADDATLPLPAEAHINGT